MCTTAQKIEGIIYWDNINHFLNKIGELFCNRVQFIVKYMLNEL
jgi:hypothetical protein